MYNKEIVNAICTHHLYEYFVINYHFNILQFSENIVKYCTIENSNKNTLDLFELVPELIGMEDELNKIITNHSTDLFIPMVFKEPNYYVNIRIQKGIHTDTLIILFENITETTKAQLRLRQVSNDNILLLQEIANKNEQLKQFNDEMQSLVKEEVAKNLEKQHMLELQTRHAQMGEIISMITHQWKQPLSVIQTVGTLLKIKVATESYNAILFDKKIDNIIKQANHMNETVKDFQQFFMPSKKKVVFKVKETIESLLGLVQMEYTLQNINIVVTGESSVVIDGYANEYNQVILSILKNAKDAFRLSPHAKMQIDIKIGRKDNGVLVSISDNAGGIPSEMLDTLFVQYMTTKIKGSGLGLYMAKRMIEYNMDGKIWAENSKQGAVFHILI